MSRFLGTVSNRLGAVASGFKYAKVYDAPGCYSLTIPPSATSAKVYVVGAGSSYCAGRYCATASACWSGVDFPVCDYSFDFCGHLTGAGGGYAEKTYNTGVGSAALNITVAGSAMTTCAYHTDTSNTVYVRGEVANSIAVGSTATSPYVSTTVSNVTYISAATTANTTTDSSSMTVTSAANINIGATVTGPGIKFNTYVTNVSGTTVTLSSVATTTISSGNYVFRSGRLYLAGNANTTSFGALTISGISTSSVSGGLASVSASSATNLPLCYTCQGNSTARNGSLDNLTSLGFSLPVCGYTQCYNGWYNTPGTGSGGDINRTGGTGLLVPEFVSTSCFDQAISVAGGANLGGWTNPTITCHCLSSFSATFGSSYCETGAPWNQSCACYYLCNSVVNCSTGSNRFFYKVTSSSEANTLGIVSTGSYNFSIQNIPYGIGASAGSSSNEGEKGLQPGTLYESNIYTTGVASGGTSGSSCTYTYTCQCFNAYDYSFGGYWCFNACSNYHPGCTTTGGICGLTSATTCCAIPIGYVCCYSANFGSGRSWGYANYYICSPPIHYSAGGSGTSQYKCLSLSYDNQALEGRKNGLSTLRLSDLRDPNGNNVNDIEYATGAYSKPAKFGGGGNRLYPAGGSGLVVILHN